MAKFCGNCGSRLDEATGLCPQCDAEALRTLKNPPKAPRKPQKHRSPLTTVLCVILVLAIVLGAGSFLLFCLTADSEAQELNTRDYQYSPPEPEDIVLEDGLGYISNELLVYLNSADDRSRLEQALEPLQGEIVGEIPVAAHYQVRFREVATEEELEALTEQLRALDFVTRVDRNLAFTASGSFYPNDSKWKGEWGPLPEGRNWAMEVIDAPMAWDHLDEMTPVRVGVYDVMFDSDHKDLHFEKPPLANETALEQCEWDDHGTHVAGTVAARFDNGRGVCGVVPKAQLYGVSVRGLETFDTLYDIEVANAFATEIALTNLIFVNNCRVINVSLGLDPLTFNASRGNVCAQITLQTMAESISLLLETFLDCGKDFIICKASGNQNDPQGGYNYYLKDDYNDLTETAYYSSHDYDKYLEGDSGSESKDRRNDYFRRHSGDLNIPISEGGRLDAGYVGAEFDFLGAISNPRVASRILMVGAVGNRGTHGGSWLHPDEEVHDGCFIAPYSQGGWRLDIMGPGGVFAEKGAGTRIYSTTRNGYGYMQGTSMACPHVAGVAALVYSVNPGLTGDEVIDILRETATGVYDGVGLVNAGAAVELALGRKIPRDAVELDGHYYYLYSVGNLEENSPAAAELFCEQLGGHLATVSTKKENDFLFQYMGSQNSGGAYIGFTDEASEGSWYWINGEPVVYTNWAGNEPNGQNPNEDYAMFYYKYADGGWNDGDFSGDAQFLCEWDAAS